MARHTLKRNGVGHFVEMTAQQMNDSAPTQVAAKEPPRHPSPCRSNRTMAG